ncbi:MAG: 7TM-DISM domain-containing protein, partial [Lysinibacillus sp.]
MKKRVKNYIIICIFIASIFALMAQYSTPLTGHAAELSKPVVLGQHYDIFRDSSNNASIEDILTGEYDKSFVASAQKYLFFWHTEDTIWLRLNTDNIIQDKQETYWLEATDKLDNIEMYFVSEDGSYEVQKSGISNLGDQNIQFRSNLFPINDPSVKEIYIKLDGALPLNLISYLFTTESFIEKIISYKFFTGIFYGFLFALLIYNLFLYFS